MYHVMGRINGLLDGRCYVWINGCSLIEMLKVILLGGKGEGEGLGCMFGGIGIED